MNTAEMIKGRIVHLKDRVSILTEEALDSYDEGMADGFDEEINFLLELLDLVERENLKKAGYNV